MQTGFFILNLPFHSHRPYHRRLPKPALQPINRPPSQIRINNAIKFSDIQYLLRRAMPGIYFIPTPLITAPSPYLFLSLSIA